MAKDWTKTDKKLWARVKGQTDIQAALKQHPVELVESIFDAIKEIKLNYDLLLSLWIQKHLKSDYDLSVESTFVNEIPELRAYVESTCTEHWQGDFQLRRLVTTCILPVAFTTLDLKLEGSIREFEANPTQLAEAKQLLSTRARSYPDFQRREQRRVVREVLASWEGRHWSKWFRKQYPTTILRLENFLMGVPRREPEETLQFFREQVGREIVTTTDFVTLSDEEIDQFPNTPLDRPMLKFALLSLKAIKLVLEAGGRVEYHNDVEAGTLESKGKKIYTKEAVIVLPDIGQFKSWQVGVF